MANREGVRGTSKYKGVSRQSAGRNWIAKTKVNQQGVYLGCYADEILAATVYDCAARILFGEFARTNFEYAEGADQEVFRRFLDEMGSAVGKNKVSEYL